MIELAEFFEPFERQYFGLIFVGSIKCILVLGIGITNAKNFFTHIPLRSTFKDRSLISVAEAIEPREVTISFTNRMNLNAWLPHVGF